MSFFVPVSTPVLDEGSVPIIRRRFGNAGRLGSCAMVQVIGQIIAFSSGILLVRWLPQREYAFFTIANAMQATLMLLADIGVSVGLISIGGRVWQDRHRFGELIKTGLAVRKKLAAVATAGLAVAIAGATFLLQYVLLRSYAAKVVDLKANENAEDRHEIVRLIRNLAANAVFYCFQGQITIFLISFFARRAASVAEVGALGRLAMIFTVLTNLLINIFVPAFARCQGKRKLRYLYAAIAGGVILFSAIVLGGAALFPDQFLFVLGNRYTHLHRELLLMVGVAVITALSGTLWLLNASKAWITGA